MAIGLPSAILLPLLQVFLAALYFKVGSPWSSVLNAKVNVFRWKTEPEGEEKKGEEASGGSGEVEMKQKNIKWVGQNSGQLENHQVINK